MLLDLIEIYHLTPGGWVLGSVERVWSESPEFTDWPTDQNCTGEPPEDRVETWKHEFHQSAVDAPEEESWLMVWSSPDVSDEHRKLLHQKFTDDLSVAFRFRKFHR
jgi:hypothetical protein